MWCFFLLDLYLHVKFVDAITRSTAFIIFHCYCLLRTYGNITAVFGVDLINYKLDKLIHYF